MQTTNYICDVCKTSKSKTDLCRIKVRTEGLRINEKGGYYNDLEIDICKDCLEKKGFIINKKTEETEEEISKKNSKTLESKIIDILDNLGVQFYE